MLEKYLQHIIVHSAKDKNFTTRRKGIKMIRTKEELVARLYAMGAIQFSKTGFEFKIHQKFPDAPKSPMKINLREPPEGLLEKEDIEYLGEIFWQAACENNLFYDAVVGLPRAGEPLAEAFIKAAKADGYSIILLSLQKKETNGKRKILPGSIPNKFRGKIILVIDDVAANGLTKIEAVRVLQIMGLTVDTCLILVDRQEGGEKLLFDIDVQLIASLKMDEMLEILVKKKIITNDLKQRIANYGEEIQKYVEERSK